MSAVETSPHVQERPSMGANQCSRRDRAETWGRFSLGTTCLVVPEQLGLTFRGAEPSGLGPSSLSNVTSLRSKGTPDPSIPPSSVSVGSEAGVRLVKGGPQRPSRWSRGPRERGGYSTEMCCPFWFGEVSPHPSSESSENVSSATRPPQTVM